MANKNESKNAPAWARYGGEKYKSDFAGTAEQKKAHDKAVAELFSNRSKDKKGGGK